MNHADKRTSILEKYTSAIIAAAVIIVLLGAMVGFKLPNTLLPSIERPQIRVVSSWPGKNASEIEQSLIAPLERTLGNLPYLKQMTTTVENGTASTGMKFHADADMEQIYVDTLSRINQVPNWPAQVPPPRIFNYSTGSGEILATLFLHGTGGNVDEYALIQAYNNYVLPMISKISGISAIDVTGTPIAKRVNIEFDPQLLNQYSLTQAQVLAAISDMADRSGGTLTMGTKEYALNFKNQIELAELEQLAIASRGQQIIRLGDVASVHLALASDWQFNALEGQQALYFMLTPSQDVNILQTIAEIKRTISQLNEGALGNQNMALSISRDDSHAIIAALMLVYGSLIAGVLLACGVLYWFLRDLPGVLLVFLSIPVCLSVVLLLMYLGGYSLNVISLAGMALSVGLLLDASIVVVDNIQRLRAKGLAVEQSIWQGAKEVRGALVSSTVSSIIVFLPILFMQSSESQLFKDLAFTISSALIASILFALILLPSVARKLLHSRLTQSGQGSDASAQASAKSAKWTQRLTAVARKPLLAKVVVVVGIPVALLLTYFAMPAVDVLPNPKKNMVSVYIYAEQPVTPEAARSQIAEVVIERIKQQQSVTELPIITHGVLCYPEGCMLYFYTKGDWDFNAFKAWIRKEVTQDLVGTRVYISHRGLLSFSMPNNRVSRLYLRGADLTTLQEVGGRLSDHLKAAFPDAKIRARTALKNHSARIEFTPKQDQLMYFGMSRAQLNRHLQAVTDGVYLGHFYTDNQSLPFYFKGRDVQHLDQILNIEIMVPGHGLVPLRDLTEAQITLAPESLLRVDQEISVALNLTPADSVAMGDFMVDAQQAIDEFMVNEDPALYVSLGGSADNLKIFLQEFVQIFIAAVLILAILMWLTLKSWRLAMAVIVSMPLAILGGMLNLQLLNLFTTQNLDLITMIGFVILMGLVINNAILLVDNFQLGLNKGLSQLKALSEAVNARKRPIYMSTSTTILGMLPLMISPASSAEMYRGLAAVIVGGMVFSALFSIPFMSALLSQTFFARKSGAEVGQNNALNVVLEKS